MSRAEAFTLIELLIVVAIIAILAAIALPNFMEAQVRAKTSRMRSDLRTLTTAVEAYHVDHNHYPPHRTQDSEEIGYPDRFFPLTTPVSYIASIPARDVFYRYDIEGQGGSKQWVSWTNFAGYGAGHILLGAVDTHRWLLRSRGPDGMNESNDVRNALMLGQFTIGFSMLYDPTNGTVSRGDLVRTARLK